MKTGPENLSIDKSAGDPNHVVPEPDADVAAAVSATPQEMAQAGRIITKDSNPAEAPPIAETLEQAKARLLRERGQRVDLTNVERTLEVPQIEGYHLHWFLETNVPRALQAWYEYVDPTEVPTHDRSVGGRPAGTHSEDLGGDRVAQIGGLNERGLPVQLVLMKIRLEWYHATQKKLAERNKAIIMQMFGKKKPIKAPQETDSDYNQRYVREAAFDMSAGRFRKADSTP